jgi:hypothetical protein
MFLLITTIISIAVFCVYHGYIVAGIICLLGLSKKVGFIALMITSIMLFAKGHWIVGALPILLIGINLLFMDKKKMKDVIEK